VLRNIGAVIRFDPYLMHFDTLFYLIRCGGNIFETGVARAFGL